MTRRPTLSGRAGVEIQVSNPLIDDLRDLMTRHGLSGGVLVSFDLPRDTIASTAVATDPRLDAFMGELGDELLAYLDDARPMAAPQ